MGWLYSEQWPTRKDLIAYLLDDSNRQCKTLRHCCVGNHLWTLNEMSEDGKPQRFITLFIMQFHSGTHPYWGYKDVEETCHPYAYSCPVSYLDQCTEPYNSFSRDWRQAVRERHALKKRRLNVGDKFLINKQEYKVLELRKRSGYVIRQLSTGNSYRMSFADMVRVDEIVKCTTQP